MAFSYPKFHGRKDEDVVDFLEQMEIACINNHVVHEEKILKLLKVFLKDDARDWLKLFEATEAVASPCQVLTLNRFKEGFLARFQPIEDPSMLWQELKDVKQRKEQSVDSFVHVFTSLWTRWSVSLKGEVPPLFYPKELVH